MLVIRQISAEKEFGQEWEQLAIWVFLISRASQAFNVPQRKSNTNDVTEVVEGNGGTAGPLISSLIYLAFQPIMFIVRVLT